LPVILCCVERRCKAVPRTLPGDWPSALAPFGYAAGFSFAYFELGAATGLLPFALALVLISAKQLSASSEGVLLAVASGTIASGLGYAVWYTALPLLRASTAATVQLSVPVIAATGAVLMLGESLSWRMAGASMAILGGIALVLKRN
jgi:drug/metabolite transporter (DMT)-like permease